MCKLLQNISSVERKRNLYLDVVKGTAIILVILGHSIQYGNGVEYYDSDLFYGNILFKFIYSFHMPLFMLISGYLFYYSIKGEKELTRIIVKKTRSLLLPVISFGIIIQFPELLHSLANWKTLLYFSKGFVRFMFLNNHLWFLWSVFLNMSIVLIVHKFKDSIYLYLTLWFCLLLLPSYRLIPQYSFMFPYFVIGYLINKHNALSKLSINYKIICALLFLYLCLFAFYDTDTYVYVSGQHILRAGGLYYFMLDIYRFAIGLIGSALVLLIIFYIYRLIGNKSRLICCISTLGLCSLGIYCFQETFFFYYKTHIISNISGFSALATLLTFTLAIGISFALTILSRQNKLTRLLLLGGR